MQVSERSKGIHFTSAESTDRDSGCAKTSQSLGLTRAVPRLVQFAPTALRALGSWMSVVNGIGLNDSAPAKDHNAHGACRPTMYRRSFRKRKLPDSGRISRYFCALSSKSNAIASTAIPYPAAPIPEIIAVAVFETSELW